MIVFAQSIVLQEVPGEVSLALAISGCPRQCPGCSWSGSDLGGEELGITEFERLLENHRGLATCVLFLGGEWAPEFLEYLTLAKSLGFETCLYTGDRSVAEEIRNELTYLKTGEYIEALGGLDSPTTNQIFTDLRTGNTLNHKFIN